jgi:hypothetical protein
LEIIVAGGILHTVNSADDAKHFVKYGTEGVCVIISMDRWNIDRFHVCVAHILDVLGVNSVDVVLLHFVRSVFGFKCIFLYLVPYVKMQKNTSILREP